ncbi:MAG: TetR/AcrR family transcriptional regulator [Solidesulfovibrio sp. DCME]|uniref:TetR/AcrR family transcriptional regulator n=1 Tax=Solidesulfovibrio sp. DCME TaxID=3447380 RepID=UPI003D100314
MKRIHSKDTLLQVGLDLVWSRGFNGTGVEAILKEAKIPKGSFYNFFSSKEEFSLAVIDKFVAGRAEVLSPILNDASLPPIERVKNSFETIIETDARQFTIKSCKYMQLVYIFSIEIDGGEHERTHFFQARHCRLRCCPSQTQRVLSRRD